jgi:ABC-type cobalamin/Fe3+-siderophores transport system ATPase subunit
VISELRRTDPETRALQWFEQRPSRQLLLSVLTLGVLTLGEIGRGMEWLSDGERQRAPVAQLIQLALSLSQSLLAEPTVLLLIALAKTAAIPFMKTRCRQ